MSGGCEEVLVVMFVIVMIVINKANILPYKLWLDGHIIVQLTLYTYWTYQHHCVQLKDYEEARE